MRLLASGNNTVCLRDPGPSADSGFDADASEEWGETAAAATTDGASRPAEQRLREAAGRWNDLVAGAPLVVVGLDHRGRIAFVNQFFLSLTGYEEHEVVGCDWFSTFLPPDCGVSVQQVFENVLDASGGDRHVNPIVTKAGEERMIAWFNTTRRGSDGSVQGTLGLGEDITDRVRAELAQSELADQLQRALDSRVVLEQAKGFISCLRGISPEEAFERLRGYARSHHEDVHAVARRILRRELML